MKWLTILFFCLFMLKSVQSCNRNMGTKLSEKEYKHTIDSLTKKYDILERQSSLTIKELEYKLEIEREKTDGANKRAEAVTEVAKRNNVINMQFENVADSLKKR